MITCLSDIAKILKMCSSVVNWLGTKGPFVDFATIDFNLLRVVVNLKTYY